MSVFIEVDSVEVKERSWTNKATGRVEYRWDQTAYLYTGKKFPLEFTIAHDEPGKAHAPGYYLISGGFRLGQYGPEFSNRDLELQPLKDGLAEFMKLPGVKAAG